MLMTDHEAFVGFLLDDNNTTDPFDIAKALNTLTRCDCEETNYSVGMALWELEGRAISPDGDSDTRNLYITLSAIADGLKNGSIQLDYNRKGIKIQED